MTDLVDQKIIRRLQGDFPLVPAPYRLLASEIGISEQELLTRLQRLKSAGVLRKMGAVLQHRLAGFHGNALCCWRVPEDRINGITAGLAARADVSHVYMRQPHEKWPYNLYTVFHGHTREECRQRIDTLAREMDLAEYQVLFSSKNWKRSRLALLQEPT